MKNKLFMMRVIAANLLVRLANKIRPKAATQFMKDLENALKYGDGGLKGYSNGKDKWLSN